MICTREKRQKMLYFNKYNLLISTICCLNQDLNVVGHQSLLKCCTNGVRMRVFPKNYTRLMYMLQEVIGNMSLVRFTCWVRGFDAGATWWDYNFQRWMSEKAADLVYKEKATDLNSIFMDSIRTIVSELPLSHTRSICR